MLPIYGGINFKSGNKTITSPIQELIPPEYIFLQANPLDTFCVSVGEKVSIGQPLINTVKEDVTPLYATVSGVIDSISETNIIIKNDFKNTIFSGLSKTTVPLTSLDASDIEEKVRNMKIYDDGKLLSDKLKISVGKIENIIVNCTDCEPPIGINHRILYEKLDEMLGGIKILIHATRARVGIIAIDSMQQNAVENLRKKINDPNLILFRIVENKYPMGNDKVLLHALMHKEYQSDNIIMDSKSLILKPETLVNVYDSFTTGVPVVKKLLTISGGVNQSKNISVPIGTRFSHIVLNCGGSTRNDPKLVIGGIMSGKVSTFDQVVSYDTDSITILETESYQQKKCIRCGRCIDVCPMILKPIYLYSNIINSNAQKNDRLGFKHCILCGCCSFVCPSKIPLCQTFKENHKSHKDG